MKPLFSHLQDTVAGTVGYVWRVVAGANRVKDAVFYSVPGYYARPGDEDDDTGRQDCLHMESGDERIVFATRNAKGTENLLGDLGRDLDKGESVITAEDGTGRCYISLRPAGTLVVSSDDGGGNTITITADETTGDLTLQTSNDIILDTTGVVNIGAAANSFIARITELQALYVALKANFDTHGHQYFPGPLGAAFTNGPGAEFAPSVPPQLHPAWDANIASTTGRSD